ncbi:MAG: SRPBCC family protein [Methyloceanibacter sp.]|uniref:SRPBCC family protein n=1 Tax=Methyloceanibacter sp. TaxID=1965321 RepID=UPI003D6CF460
MLKKILFVLAALILVFVVVVALQPSEFHVERTATVDTPAAAVFAEVNDFHKWDAWSPWAKLDPNAKVTFEGPEAGEGTVMTWAGNSEVGAGKMTLVESRPDELVKIRLDFTEPFEGTSGSEFVFKPEGDKTAVTWSMSDHHNFMERAVCLVMNGKKMVGDQMEKGLANLKSVVESKS